MYNARGQKLLLTGNDRRAYTAGGIHFIAGCMNILMIPASAFLPRYINVDAVNGDKLQIRPR